MQANSLVAIFVIAMFPFTSLVSAQEVGEIGPSPYENVAQTWMQPFAEEGFTLGRDSRSVCTVA